MLAFSVLLFGCQAPSGTPQKDQPPVPAAAPPDLRRPADHVTNAARHIPDTPAFDPIPDVPPDTAAKLFKKGDWRAKEGKWDEALAWWRWAYLKDLPNMRGLAFKYPVVAKFMRRDQLQHFIKGELAAEYPPEKSLADDLAYSLFGFFERAEVQLGPLMEELYTQEIAGFYNPDDKGMFLIAATGPGQKKGLFNKLLGGSGPDPVEQKAVLAHELDHALADQHFDLLSMQRSAQHDDDMSTALTGLIEGEAMVIMMLSVLPPRDRPDFMAAPPAALSLVMDLVLPIAASFATGPAFRNAPQITRELMLVPYTKGMSFALSVLQDGGWPRMNAAFAAPPISTEQLLHADRYLNPADDPTFTFQLGDPPEVLRDWKLVKENTLGELALRVLLSPAVGLLEAEKAADGWDGDTYRIYQKGDLAALLWVSEWDTHEQALELQRALLQVSDETDPCLVEVRGTRVLAVRGDLANMPSYIDYLAQAKAVKKSFVLKKHHPKVAFPAEVDPRLAVKHGSGIEVPGVSPSAARLLDGLGLTDKKLSDQATALADEACACADDACKKAVADKAAAWFDEKKKGLTLRELDRRRLKSQAERLARCAAPQP